MPPINRIMSGSIREQLSIVADAAKHDVSCASSGSNRKNTDGRADDTGSQPCAGILSKAEPQLIHNEKIYVRTRLLANFAYPDESGSNT